VTLQYKYGGRNLQRHNENRLREREGKKTVTIERIEKLGKDPDDYSRHTHDIEKNGRVFSLIAIHQSAEKDGRVFLKHSDTAEKDGRVSFSNIAIYPSAEDGRVFFKHSDTSIREDQSGGAV